MKSFGGRITGWSLRGSVFAALLAVSTAVASERINKDAEGVAILGDDTVAYFTEGRPVKAAPTSSTSGRTRGGGSPAPSTGPGSPANPTATPRSSVASARAA